MMAAPYNVCPGHVFPSLKKIKFVLIKKQFMKISAFLKKILKKFVPKEATKVPRITRSMFC